MLKRFVFFSVAYQLDVSRVNARTVAILQNRGPVPDSRAFGFALVRALVTPHIVRRMERHGIQTFVKLSAKVYLGKSLLLLLVPALVIICS